MTVLFQELKRNKLSLIIWSAAISFMLGICVIIYPEMSSQMGEISEMFADMGSFSAAFGMDKINFGEFSGYFGIECGNTLGLGGAFFAAILGICALSKEEKDRTAEFLLTHPISRKRIILEKLLCAYFQIVILNLTAMAVTSIAILAIGETIKLSTLFLLFLGYFLLQIQICSICFGISAFLKGNGLGIGLGISLAFYFLNILSNLSEKAEILKYISPFSYSDGSAIVSSNELEIKYLAVGLILSVIGIVLGFIKYSKKDIA